MKNKENFAFLVVGGFIMLFPFFLADETRWTVVAGGLLMLMGWLVLSIPAWVADKILNKKNI